MSQKTSLWTQLRAALKGRKMSDYTPSRGKHSNHLDVFTPLANPNMRITILGEDTGGPLASTLYSDTFGPGGAVKITTESQVYYIWLTPHGMRLRSYSSPSLEEELTTGRHEVS
jgi:hypothetical protein